MNISRRNFSKLATLSVASTVFGPITSIAKATHQEQVLGHGSHRYKIAKGWGVLGPATPVKDCHEMVQDSKGRLILLTNETRNNVIFYDRSGKFLNSWGNDFPGAHGLTLSKEGTEDFLFITDHDRHQIYKTSLDGRVILTIDWPQETGKYEKQDQFKPTETTVGPNGDIYVADGYGLDYIVQYDPKGQLKNIFGGKGTTQAHLKNAHGVTLDSRNPTNPILLITSREENCFKQFSLEGKYLSTIQLPGAYICRPVLKGKELYFPVLVSKMPWDSRSGFVTILNKDNVVISNPGGTEPVYKEGKLQPMGQSATSPFQHPHDVCVDDDENIYIPQWNSGKTYPLKLERI